MKTLGYYNGKYGEIDEMTIPMNDRACWFGDGVYDATCCGNYVIFNLEEHIDRFYNSAGLLGIKIPMQKAELAALLSDLVRKLDSPDQFVYWQTTRGTAPRNHAFPKEGSAKPHTTRHQRVYRGAPSDLFGQLRSELLKALNDLFLQFPVLCQNICFVFLQLSIKFCIVCKILIIGASPVNYIFAGVIHYSIGI